MYRLLYALSGVSVFCCAFWNDLKPCPLSVSAQFTDLFRVPIIPGCDVVIVKRSRSSLYAPPSVSRKIRPSPSP